MEVYLRTSEYRLLCLQCWCGVKQKHRNKSKVLNFGASSGYWAVLVLNAPISDRNTFIGTSHKKFSLFCRQPAEVENIHILKMCLCNKSNEVSTGRPMSQNWCWLPREMGGKKSVDCRDLENVLWRVHFWNYISKKYLRISKLLICVCFLVFIPVSFFMLYGLLCCTI